MTPPPVLEFDFPDAMLQAMWTSDLYYYWKGHFHPIEDEL